MKVKSRRTHLSDAEYHVRNAEQSLLRANIDPSPDRDVDLSILELSKALQKVRYRLQRWQKRMSS